MSSLRVATYNLLHGGQGGGDRTRLDAALEVLTDSNPQILMLQEARGFECDGGRLLHEVERRLGCAAASASPPHRSEHCGLPRAVGRAARLRHRLGALPPCRRPRDGRPSGPRARADARQRPPLPVSPAARLAEVALLADLAAPDRSGYPEAEFVPFRADRVLLSPPWRTGLSATR